MTDDDRSQDLDSGQMAAARAAGVHHLPTDQRPPDTHRACVGGQPLPGGQRIADTQSFAAAGDPSSYADHRTPDAHWRTVGVVPAPEDDLLLIYADTLSDLEETRIRTANRLRALTTAPMVGEKGGVFGKGFPADAPEAVQLAALASDLAAIEHAAELQLARVIRKHPLGGWVKNTRGVGEKTGARLIATIGNPLGYWTRDGEWVPRTVSMLWAYAGYHVIDGRAPVRRRGEKANWNPDVKKRAWLCAEGAIKAGVRKLDDDTDGYDPANRVALSPLGAVYLDARAKHLNATHRHECARCGPKGSPAPKGSPLSGAHQKARAERLVAKEILCDLWRYANDLSAGQDAVDPHDNTAGGEPSS